MKTEKLISDDIQENIEESSYQENDGNASIETENSEVEKLKKEVEKQKEFFLRTAAEYENFRKRTEREKISIYNDVKASTILELLPIADSIERAILNLGNASDEYKKGIEMINEQLKSSFKKLNVESFGKEGETFNPDIHNAISHVEDTELDDNVIVEVFQKGYKCNEKIIRYAMVKVAN